jgi:hypothetical protein
MDQDRRLLFLKHSTYRQYLRSFLALGLPFRLALGLASVTFLIFAPFSVGWWVVLITLLCLIGISLSCGGLSIAEVITCTFISSEVTIA